MLKIAVIDKCPAHVDYTKYIPFLKESDKYDVSLHHMSSIATKKLLKRDVDLEIDLDEYDFVLLIGSEAAKEYAKVTSVTSHAGLLVDDKFLPMINPAMLSFKPEMGKAFDASVQKAHGFITGEWTPPTKGDYVGITTKAAAIHYFTSVLNNPSVQVVGMDSETSSLYPREGRVLGISMSHAINQGVYVDSDVIDETVSDLIQNIIDTKTVVMHNAKFDVKWLEYHFGFKFRDDTDDTMLLHYVLDETQGTHGLKQLAIKYTNLGDYDKPLDDFKKEYCRLHKVKQADFSYELIPFNIMYDYAAKDTAATLELYLKFYPLVVQSPQLSNVYFNILRPGMRFLNNMEENGVPFDIPRLEAGQTLMSLEIAKSAKEIYSFPEVHKFEELQGNIFNPNSTVQLRKLLFDLLGLTKTGKKTGTGADSTDAEVLKELSDQHALPASILSTRQLTKIKSTYLDKILPALDCDSRLRTGFNLTSTTSGRLSSSGKLNMQQLPRDNKIVKACIKARKGYKIVSQDLQTAEMYIAAILSDDKKLQSVFSQGGDFHSAIAKMVFNLPCAVEDVKELYGMFRQAAKSVSFGIMYGSGAQSVADTVSEFNMEQHIKTGEPYVPFTKADAQDAIETYFATYSRLKKWLDLKKAEIQQNGYIYSAFGRKRRLPNVFSSDRGIAAGEVRSGINFLVQSVASDVNLMAAMDLEKEIIAKGLDVKIFALVHDSILCEVREDQVDETIAIMAEVTQRDRGVTIKDSPIGVDAEIGDDYSFLDAETLAAKYPEISCAA